jgi:CHAT domain-containing protein/tetratricopeptide (TPR) repeat protein
MAGRAFVLLLALAACGPSVGPPREWPAGELRSGGRAVTAPLRPGEIHRYRLPLAAGRLLRLVVDQRGIDAVVSLEDPAGAPILQADRLIDDRGPELVLAVTRTAGAYTLVVRGSEKSTPGRYAARVEALRPATAADWRSAEAYRNLTSGRDLAGALATWGKLGETALAAEAMMGLASQHHGRGEYQQAADRFAQAGDLRWEAIARHELSSSLVPLFEAREAAAEETRSLDEARREGDHQLEAKALHGLGQALQYQGDLQGALDRYQEALALWPRDDRHFRPYTLHQLGVLHARLLHDGTRGRDLLLQARNAWLPELGAWKARTLRQLGQLAFEEGRLDEARGDFAAALDLRRESDPCGSAALLAASALVEEKGAQPRKADERLAGALHIVETQPCPRSEPEVHLLAGGLAEGRSNSLGARAEYRRSEALYAKRGDLLGMAESLAGLARSARGLGDLPAAREASGRVLAIFEGVRPKVLREDLRTSFFSAARDAFDFHIDLLMRMGASAEAWTAAERARARTLGDLLAESGAGLRRDAAPGLAARERELQRRLNALETQRLATNDAEKLAQLRESIAGVIADLESARGEIRRRSPRYAALTQPEPVSAAAVQRELLDADTLLLEYRLGPSAGTVWAMSHNSLTAARLPPREDVERLARQAASLTRSHEWPGHNPPALCELSRALLAPVAAQLGRRRLVVVPDGALAGVSFAALPDPADPASCPTARPLMEDHEIAYLPSAATLLAQRHLLTDRKPVPKWLAVVADPIYAPPLSPLPASAQEARAITAGLPPEKIRLATGAAASRESVTGGALRDYRILHFAVHGELDAEQPLLSALVLSQRDGAGRPVAGALPAHEIYDLDLPAELVVLSACETALGREVPGEGLVSGLPRAFLYAGADRVVVSLWSVDDRATRDLMTLFYHGLFGGLGPARALQEAQRALLRSGRPPRDWAGFVLLGDWRPLPPFSR